MEKNIGKKGTLVIKGEKNVGDMVIEVKVLGAKKVFGRVLYQVTPVAGSGEVWKEKVTFTK
jgi:hypothetical protein